MAPRRARESAARWCGRPCRPSAAFRRRAAAQGARARWSADSAARPPRPAPHLAGTLPAARSGSPGGIGAGGQRAAGDEYRVSRRLAAPSPEAGSFERETHGPNACFRSVGGWRRHRQRRIVRARNTRTERCFRSGSSIPADQTLPAAGLAFGAARAPGGKRVHQRLPGRGGGFEDAAAVRASR